MTRHPFIDHIVDPVLPARMKARFALRHHPSHRDPLAHLTPGLEGSFLVDSPCSPTLEYAFAVHAIVDKDYAGQYAYMQIARRFLGPDNRVQGPFGDWHYGFYYRNADSGWESWVLDTVHGTKPPSYAEFGAYIDANLATEAALVAVDGSGV